MAPSTPEQQRVQARFESLIALAAPLLDLVLAAGDQISRVAGRDDDPIPIRAPGQAFDLGSSRRDGRLGSGTDGTVG